MKLDVILRSDFMWYMMGLTLLTPQLTFTFVKIKEYIDSLSDYYLIHGIG
jgi:hypothetical protein